LFKGWKLPASARRWFAFYAVGALGFLLQLATLALLVRQFGWRVMPAAAMAVEAAIVHNFIWHARWTWVDRAAPGWPEICRRFFRFNLTNGGLSIAGNLFFMRIFLETLPIDYLAANFLAMLACSVLNFYFSDRFVFRRRFTSGMTLACNKRLLPAPQIIKEEP
jgi:putative flippase GtrA